MNEPPTKETAVQALPQTRPRTTPWTDAAVQSLFNAHHERIYRVARRITGRPEDAEDVLQTVFLRLMRREDSIPLAEDAAGYLHRAASNAALDVLRRRKAARSEPLEPNQRHFDASPDPERARASAEIRTRVLEALASLPPRTAQIFALRYFEGFGNREIARLMNTSWSTVAVTLHRTRAKLQSQLKGDLQ